MKVIVTGSQGQLGWELQQSCPISIEGVFLSKNELDITDLESVEAVVGQHKPDAMINAAAYTAVDKAESDREMAFSINEVGARNLATACRDNNCYFLHISTDFVFDGGSATPYLPTSATQPLGVYGESKLAGESAIQSVLEKNWAIVRTAWVYSAHGANFVKTMLRLMAEKPSLGIVADQIGSPTWANGLANVCWQGVFKQLSGVHHWSDAGVASWYDFAIAIQDLALQKDMLQEKIPVNPIATADFPTPAQRPSYSVLDKKSTYTVLGLEPIHWRSQLDKMLDALVRAD